MCWKTNLFFSVLCAIMKSVEGLVYVLEPCSLWELVVSFLIYCLIFLNEICLRACVCYFILYAHWFLLCSLVELWNRLCVILICWYILDNLLCVTPLCALLVYLVFCPNYISFWFLKVLCMHIYQMYMIWHALLYLIQYIG